MKLPKILNDILSPALFVVFSLTTTSATAETSVWRVQGNGNTLYLGGTLHILKDSDFPLPEQFDQAYQQSEELILEADLAAFTTPEAQQRLSNQVSWQDGSELADHVTPETLERFRKRFEQHGLPLQMIMNFKPGPAVTTLALMELEKLGISRDGVDAIYEAKARKDGRTVIGLETIDQQISFITEMGMDDPDAFINFSLDDLDGLEDVMNEMADAWRSGDMPALASVMVEKMSSMYPEVYKELLTDRNKAWVPKILAMLDDPDIELVLVGAGHLAGDGNVLELLKKAGVKIEKLK